MKENVTTQKGKRSKKIMIGFAGLASAAVVSAAGFAGATPNKPTKAQCEAQGFRNHGQCVKDWAHNKPKPNPGNGYGGASSAVNTDTSVDVEVNGDNNVIHVIINYFFG